jgi:hypothetical protein
MEIAGTVINAAVVAAIGLLLAWLGKGRFDAQDRRIEQLETRLDQGISRFDHRIDVLQASVDAMRSDLTQVALAVGARPRASNT